MYRGTGRRIQEASKTLENPYAAGEFGGFALQPGENAMELETGERMAAGRGGRETGGGTRNGKAVNISVKRESRQFCAFQS